MKGVTAIIPTYNRCGLLSRAIDSVLVQTRPVDEVIVVDDGSTDATKAEVARYGSKVRYLYQPNQGVAVARNRGVREARTDWVAFLDSDDEWLPQKIELQLDAAAREPVDICIGSYWVHLLNGERRLATPPICVMPAIRLKNLFPPSVAMVDRKTFVAYGGFREDLRTSCEDWELFCRMALKCRFALVAIPVTNYYEQPTSISLDRDVMLPKMLAIVDSLLIGLRGPRRVFWKHRILSQIHYNDATSLRRQRRRSFGTLLLSLIYWPIPDVRVKTLIIELLEMIGARRTV